MAAALLREGGVNARLSLGAIDRWEVGALSLMGVDGWHVEALLDATHARFEFANFEAIAQLSSGDAVTNDRGMIFDRGASEPDDLIAKFLACRREVGGNVGPQRVDFRADVGNLGFDPSDLGVEPSDIALGRHVRAHVAQDRQNEILRFGGHDLSYSSFQALERRPERPFRRNEA